MTDLDRIDEHYHGRTGLTLGVRERLFHAQTPFQSVEIVETDAWGRLMMIDGMVMLSEKDEFVYHEMLVHVPMMCHPQPEKVLIVGGGDGGSAREVLRHRGVRRLDMVEIDEVVIEASKRYLPKIGRFDDPRLNLIIGDGIAFVDEAAERGDRYDVILIDGSDPVGPAEGLFEAPFVDACKRALNPGGVFAAQSESPWISKYHPSMRRLHSALSERFDQVHPYLCWIPLYPAGMWSMMMASDAHHPLSEVVLRRVDAMGSDVFEGCQYYNPQVHRGAFALPGFVRQIFSTR